MITNVCNPFITAIGHIPNIVFHRYVFIAPQILIAGSSFITRLESYLQSTGRNLQVPLPTTLAGQPGLRLTGLRPLLESAISGRPPQYIILHVGANDIGYRKSCEWITELRAAIYYMRAKYRFSTIVWSDMLPRRVWRYSHPIAAEKARRRYQRRARGLVQEEGGAVIKHPMLESNLNYLAPDGVHLSAVGIEQFVQDLESGLVDLICSRP